MSPSYPRRREAARDIDDIFALSDAAITSRCDRRARRRLQCSTFSS